MKLFAAVWVMASLAMVTQVLARDIVITVKDVTFSPATVSAHVGDRLMWNNRDIVVHSATARNKAWDVVLPVNGSGKVVLKKTGHMDYYCKYHPTMTGSVDVSP